MAGPSVILGYAIGGFIAFLIMRQLGNGGGRAGCRFLQPLRLQILGQLRRLRFRLELLGAVCPVAMAELTAVGIYVQYWWPEIPTGLRRGVLRRSTPSTRQRQSLRRDGVLVRHHQGGGDYRHDRVRRLSAVQRHGRPGGHRHQPVGAGRVLPERRHGPGDGDGGDYVLLRRP